MIAFRPEEVRGPLLSGALGARRRWRRCCAGPGWTDGARRSSCSVRPGWARRWRRAAGRWCWSRPRRARSRCARRRAPAGARPLDVALAGAELPLRAGSLSALVVENVGGLEGRRGRPLAGGAGAVPPSRAGGSSPPTPPPARGRRPARRGRVPLGGADRDRPGVAARRRVADRWCRADVIRHRGTFRRRGRRGRSATEVAAPVPEPNRTRRCRGPTRIRPKPSRIPVFFASSPLTRRLRSAANSGAG